MYWIWLQQALGCGSTQAAPLLTRFASPEAIYTADEAGLRAAGLPAAVCRRLADKSMERARGILWRTLSDGDWLLTPADEAYPALLRGISAPPLVLYGRGAVPEFDRQPVIAMVGTRHMSRYGERVTRAIAFELAACGALIVSGGAVGGDAVATTAALDADAPAVTVQACGLDVCYPAQNEALRRRTLACGGTLLSEYPYGQRVQNGAFHVRNRLLSGLALGVCVTEAPQGSGTLITARYAREQGRDVFAVPGDVTSPGSAGVNQLIQQGAKLVGGAQDILEEYRLRYPHILEAAPMPLPEAATPALRAAPSAPTAPTARSLRVAQPAPKQPEKLPEKSPPATLPDGVSADARRVFAALSDTPLPVDEIAAAAELPMATVFAALTELELFGLVTPSAGQQYRR